MNKSVQLAFFDDALWFPHNPGAPVEEYSQSWDALNSFLSENDADWYGLSARSQTPTASRSFVLEVNDAGKWNLDLVMSLQSFLRDVCPNYCILVSTMPDDRTLNGSFLLVTKDDVFYWFIDEFEGTAFWNNARFDEADGVGKHWTADGYV